MKAPLFAETLEVQLLNGVTLTLMMTLVAQSAILIISQLRVVKRYLDPVQVHVKAEKYLSSLPLVVSLQSLPVDRLMTQCFKFTPIALGLHLETTKETVVDKPS